MNKLISTMLLSILLLSITLFNITSIIIKNNEIEVIKQKNLIKLYDNQKHLSNTQKFEIAVKNTFKSEK